MNIDIVHISFIVRAGAVPDISIWIVVELIGARVKTVVWSSERVLATVRDGAIERNAGGRKKAIGADAVSYPVRVSASGGGQNGTLDVKSTRISVHRSAGADHVSELRPGRDISLGRRQRKGQADILRLDDELGVGNV